MKKHYLPRHADPDIEPKKVPMFTKSNMKNFKASRVDASLDKLFGKRKSDGLTWSQRTTF